MNMRRSDRAAYGGRWPGLVDTAADAGGQERHVHRAAQSEHSVEEGQDPGADRQVARANRGRRRTPRVGKGRRRATGHLLKRARPGRGRSNPVIAKWLRAGSGGRPGDGQGTWASMLAGAHPDHLLSFLVCGPERSTSATVWQRKGSRVWTPSPSMSAAAAAGKTPSGSGDGRVGRPPRDRRGPCLGDHLPRIQIDEITSWSREKSSLREVRLQPIRRKPKPGRPQSLRIL